MRTAASFRAFLLTASFGAAFSARAQTTPAPAAPADTATPVAPTGLGIQPTTVLKLGTVLTNRTLLGFGQVVPLPLLVGVERRLNPNWALTGDLTMLSFLGNRVNLSREGYGLRVFRLGAKLGVRRYYRTEAHPLTGGYGGNYVGLNARIEALPYGALLFAGNLGLSAQWGGAAARGRPRAGRWLRAPGSRNLRGGMEQLAAGHRTHFAHHRAGPAPELGPLIHWFIPACVAAAVFRNYGHLCAFAACSRFFHARFTGSCPSVVMHAAA